MMQPEFYTAKDLVPVICETLEHNGSFTLTVTGNSMRPFLRHLSDNVELVSCEARPPKTGDIVFFRRSSGEYILHRIIGKRGDMFVINGDAQNWTEKIPPESIIAVVSKIERNGKAISCDAPLYRAAHALWRCTRIVRPVIFRGIGALRKAAGFFVKR